MLYVCNVLFIIVDDFNKYWILIEFKICFEVLYVIGCNEGWYVLL